MIDFNTYTCVQLEDVASYERAKEGSIYPRGSSTIQISATTGQVGFLEIDSEVEAKHVVIIPQSGINRKYFNVVLHKNIDAFVNRYKTGLNIQEKEIGKFPIELHEYSAQCVIAKMFMHMDQEEGHLSGEIDAMRKMKQTLLNKMLV